MKVEIYGTCAAGFEPVRQAFADKPEVLKLLDDLFVEKPEDDASVTDEGEE